MAKKKKNKGKKKKASMPMKKTLNLKINLEVEQTGYSPARGPARRKRIVSRRRPNLREVRRSMGGPTPANLKDPSFFGNTAMLSNSAMANMNNKAYALENQMREHTAEVKALQMAGQGESQQVKALQDVTAGLEQQLQLTQRLGQAAYQQGKQQTGVAEAETRQLKATRKAESASDEELKYLGVEVMGEGWTPGAFKKGKWNEVKPTLQGIHADRENEELQARFRGQMEGTHRAKAVRRAVQADTPARDSPGRDSDRAERLAARQLGFGETSLYEDSSDED